MIYERERYIYAYIISPSSNTITHHHSITSLLSEYQGTECRNSRTTTNEDSPGRDNQQHKPRHATSQATLHIQSERLIRSDSTHLTCCKHTGRRKVKAREEHKKMVLRNPIQNHHHLQTHCSVQVPGEGSAKSAKTNRFFMHLVNR